MSNEDKSQKKPQKTTTVAAGKSWWRESISRREATEKMVRVGTGVVVGGVLLYGITECDDDDDVESQHDALELQKNSGWNVGSDDKALQFPTGAVTPIDSKGLSPDFSVNIAANLLEIYRPKQANLQPYFVPTLIQALAQDSLRSKMLLINTPAMRDAYSRGLGMRDLLAQSKEAEKTLVVVDIPGAEAVAFGAALADVAEIIPTFDNWPHPLGVVPSHHTLSALWYYANEIKEKKASLPANAPVIVLLDSNRLAPYSDADNQFDNRYVAKLPTADNLASLGIANILYATPSDAQKTELDDINDDFATYREKNINVAMLPLTNFQPASDGQAAQDTANRVPAHPATAQGSSTYYYGGGHSHSTWFFYHYGWYRPMYSIPVQTRLPQTFVSRPSYSAMRRTTIFSSASMGGQAGIGKTRPAGFGRISTRVSTSTGAVTGVRAGRSGSFGRSSGRGSS